MKEGSYSKRCRPNAANPDPIFFRREVLDHFRQDPRYQVHESCLRATGGAAHDDHVGWLQQYVSATGPSGEPAIMVILAHLNRLTAEEQHYFHNFELASGSVSGDVIGPILHGVPSPTVTALYALSEALGEANRIVAPRKVFRKTDSIELSNSEEFLAISYNSKKAFQRFAHHIDIVIGENLVASFLVEGGVEPRDAQGKLKGTLTRLRDYLVLQGCAEHEADAIVTPFKRARKIRQTPAHSLSVDDSQEDYRSQQEQLFSEVVGSLRSLVMELGEYFYGEAWAPPAHLTQSIRSMFE